MSKKTIDWNVWKDVSWWHWALTVPLLASHLAGYAWALEIAIGMCTLVGGYFALRLKRIQPLPVQVRVAYLGLLLCGTLPGLQWVHWVQFFGTTAMVTLGYCPLLRMLSIAPWNRTEPPSLSLIWQIFVREPCAGGLVRWSSSSSDPGLAACSMRTSGSPIACSITSGHSTDP